MEYKVDKMRTESEFKDHTPHGRSYFNAGSFSIHSSVRFDDVVDRFEDYVHEHKQKIKNLELETPDIDDIPDIEGAPVYSVVKKNRFGVAQNRLLSFDGKRNVIRILTTTLKCRSEFHISDIKEILVVSQAKSHLKIVFRDSRGHRAYQIIFGDDDEFSNFNRTVSQSLAEHSDQASPKSAASKATANAYKTADAVYFVNRKIKRSRPRLLCLVYHEQTMRFFEPKNGKCDSEITFDKIDKIQGFQSKKKSQDDRAIIHFIPEANQPSMEIQFASLFERSHFCDTLHALRMRLTFVDFEEEFCFVYRDDEVVDDEPEAIDFRLTAVRRTREKNILLTLHIDLARQKVLCETPSGEVIAYRVKDILELVENEDSSITLIFEPLVGLGKGARGTINSLAPLKTIEYELEDEEIEYRLYFVSRFNARRFVKTVEAIAPLETEKRAKVLEEIVLSEGTYVEGLETLVDQFQMPLQRDDIIGEEELDKIFSNVEQLTELHQSFFAQLCRMDNIPNTFAQFGDFLRMYTAYVSIYDIRLQCIESLRNDDPFQTFLTMKKRTGKSLMNFIILPVQRIPRYVMLLSELRKRTPKRHPEYGILDDQCHKITQIAHHVNEDKRNVENMVKLLSLSEKILKGPTLVQPHRKLRQEGPLKQKVDAVLRKSKLVSVMVILLSDILMWTDDNWKFRGQFELELLSVDSITEGKDDLSIEIKPDPAKIPVKQKKRPAPVVFVCDSENQRKQWMEILVKTSEEYEANKESFRSILGGEKQILVHEGWLKKKGTVNTSWKKRYFVLRGTVSEKLADFTLFYSKSEHSIILGSVSLRDVHRVYRDTEQGEEHGFLLLTADRMWALAAESKDFLDTWLSQLHICLTSNKMKQIAVSFNPKEPIGIEFVSGGKVIDVEDNTQAYRKGVRVGWILVAVNGETVTFTHEKIGEEFRVIISECTTRDTIALTFDISAQEDEEEQKSKS